MLKRTNVSFQLKSRHLLLITFAVLVLVLAACSQSFEWQEQYDLGVRYLSEGNYKEAIIAFTAAIEIEPKLAEAYICRGQAYVGMKHEEGTLELALADYLTVIEFAAENVEAYLGAADVYIRMGEYNKALEVLQQGAENIDDQRIKDKIDELEQGIRVDSDGNYRKTAYTYMSYEYGGEIELFQIDDVVLTPQGEWIYSKNTYSLDDTIEVGSITYVEYVYGSDGKQLQKNYYNGNGTLSYYEDIILDADGKEVSKTVNDSFEKFSVQYIDVEYDEIGKKISEKYTLDFNDIIRETRYYYDDLGYLYKKEKYEDGELVAYEEYK